jgi:hypothetical protein
VEIVSSLSYLYLYNEYYNSSLKVASTIYSDLRKRGELIEDPNLLIASICIANDLSLMTGNKKHFERLKRYGLKLI